MIALITNQIIKTIPYMRPVIHNVRIAPDGKEIIKLLVLLAQLKLFPLDFSRNGAN